jgi:acyl-CoA hydrolase
VLSFCYAALPVPNTQLVTPNAAGRVSDLTLTHRLILPVDTNHHGTLYAGSLMRIALEAAYATAFRAIGHEANLLLRRVLAIECYRPVREGSLVEIRGAVLHATRAYLVAGLIGAPLPGQSGPWMDALFGFAQVDEDGRAAEFPADLAVTASGPEWKKLQERMKKLLKIRGRNGRDD